MISKNYRRAVTVGSRFERSKSHRDFNSYHGNALHGRNSSVGRDKLSDAIDNLTRLAAIPWFSNDINNFQRQKKISEQKPYDPKFGPENCDHYPEGGVFQGICKNTPNNSDTNCARKCLADKYPDMTGKDGFREYWLDPDLRRWLLEKHPECWRNCGFTPADLL